MTATSDAGWHRLIERALENNITTLTGGAEAELLSVRLRRIRDSAFFYTSWRPMFRGTVHYRTSNKHYKKEIFAKSQVSAAEYERVTSLSEGQAQGSAVVRPIGFESDGERTIMLTEFVPGWNLSLMISVARLPGIAWCTRGLVRGWAMKTGRWLSDFQSDHLTVSPDLTRREVERTRSILGGLDVLSSRQRDLLDRYLVDGSESFLQVHRAPSIDFQARNLLYDRGRLVFLDLEPLPDRNIFHDGLRFCTALRNKTRFGLYPRTAFDLVERGLWEAFDSRGDETNFPYAKVLLAVEYLDYLLMARREYWKPSAKWDEYIRQMVAEALGWLPADRVRIRDA